MTATLSPADASAKLLDVAAVAELLGLFTTARLPPFRCRQNAGTRQARGAGPLVRFRQSANGLMPAVRPSVA